MYSISVLVSVVFGAIAASAFIVTQTLDFAVDSSDAQLTTVELISKYGYQAEIHQVQTEDGYLLEMHRVSGNSRAAADPNRPPVFLMHGLLASSADFVLVGPSHALVYQLSDLGYDVWLGNARGNRYSRKHVNLTANMNQFWNFSWHEIGIYDLPAMIDYVLSYTGKQKLHYLGHSQGTTSFFVMTSMKPEYNDKIVLMQAMAPVAFMEHMSSPLLKFFVDNLPMISTIIDLFGMGEFQPLPSVLVELAKYICPSSQSNNLCVNVLFQLTGDDPDQIDPEIQVVSAKKILIYKQVFRPAIMYAVPIWSSLGLPDPTARKRVH
ncbi:lipase 3-like [Uranotaenia lowii]|uniref:lipase 3-like n=1 Tax=Uranotaenia lowii TaxID=190385 RepID=UPI00247A7C94|nr:lipase 3-like [Uranotaenia lowii]